MKDFETHTRGTFEEIRLSRMLANEIEETCQQLGLGALPQNVITAYMELCKHYAKQIESEML